MAYVKVTENKKGELVAKIQVSGKDPSTGKNKVYSKRVHNEYGLTTGKFKRYAEKIGIEFEEEITEQYKNGITQIKTRILTFDELATEWITTIKNNLSHSYYLRATDATKKFNDYLKRRNLFTHPISEITVRDIQLFINSMDTYLTRGFSRLIKPLPSTINFRELDRQGIINRNTYYQLTHNHKGITIERAYKICDYANIKYEDYFVTTSEERTYSSETVKGVRRVIRAIFNEAMRYDWITKNPVILSKIGAGNGNISLNAIKEKEVFSEHEAQLFLRNLDALPDEFINRKICLKMLLLTGIRIAELNGLRWSDVDFSKRVIHVRRNRLHSTELGSYEKEPKTKTSIRDIPLPDNLIEDLMRYEKWFRIADDNFDLNINQYYIASSIYRKPLGASTVSRWLSYYENKWNTKKISCHGLRHTYCSLLLLNNVPIQTVSRYMGHSDSTVTLKVYSHFIPESQDRVLYVLNNIIDKGD